MVTGVKHKKTEGMLQMKSFRVQRLACLYEYIKNKNLCHIDDILSILDVSILKPFEATK